MKSDGMKLSIMKQYHNWLHEVSSFFKPDCYSNF